MTKRSKVTKRAKKKRVAKKRSAKRVSKKKAGKKKASRKRKPRGKRSGAKALEVEVHVSERDVPHPDNLQTQQDVWATYERVRSLRAVAKELGVGKWIVGHVMGSDLNRKLDILIEHCEHMVAHWETHGAQALRIMGKSMEIVEQQVDHILECQKKDMPVTEINHPNGSGMPMTTFEAINLIVCGKAMSQMLAIAEKAHTISAEFRGGESALAKKMMEAQEGRQRGYESMSDLELALAAKEAKIYVPPVLQARIDLAAKQAGG